MTTTADVSKIVSYAVLNENGPNASKVVSYAVLNERGPNASKIVSYAVLVQQGDLVETATATDAVDATSTANTRGLVEAASAADAVDATSTGNTRDLAESASAADTIVGIYFGIIDPGPVEAATATDMIDASFTPSGGGGGIVRATQVVMQVLMPAPQHLRPWVWVNW